MLSSTPTSRKKATFSLGKRETGRVRRPPRRLRYLDVDHDQQDPHSGGDDGDAGEQVARAGAEGAGSADAAERAGQAAALAALDQDQQHHEEADYEHQN